MRKSVFAVLLVAFSATPVLSDDGIPFTELHARLSPTLARAAVADNVKLCDTQELGLDYCSVSYAVVAAHNYGNGKLDKAAAALEKYRRSEIQSSGSVTPCFARKFEVGGSGQVFRIEYYHALYVINHARQEMAYAHDIRAFLCAAFRDPKGFDASVMGIGRHELKEYIKLYHSGDDRYDVDLYMDGINVAINQGYKDIRKGTNFGMDYRRDTLDSIKLAELYKNAAKRARKLGLAPEFVSFLKDWQTFREKVAQEQALNGGVD